MLSKKQIGKLLNQENINLFVEKMEAAQIDVCFVGSCVEKNFLQNEKLEDSNDFSLIVHSKAGKVLDNLQREEVSVFPGTGGNLIASQGNDFFHMQEV